MSPGKYPYCVHLLSSLLIPLTNVVYSVRTVSYGPRFFPLIYGPSAKRVNRRVGKETSQSEAEGSTATKNAVPKSQKLNLLGC